MSPEYKSLLALKMYLNSTDAKQLETMVKKKESLDDINVFVNGAMTNKQINNTVKFSMEEAKLEYKEYEDKLNPEELKWVQKFYAEMYCNNLYSIPKDYRLLKTKEMVKESNRIRNSRKTDMFEIGIKAGKLEPLDSHQLSETDEEVDWETVYSLFGHECSLNFLIDECMSELKAKSLDTRLTLVRFYIKMNRLRLAHNREGRNK